MKVPQKDLHGNFEGIVGEAALPHYPFTQSKHLKGQLDPLVRQVTFLDHQGGQSIKMKSTHIMIGNSNNIKKF